MDNGAQLPQRATGPFYPSVTGEQAKRPLVCHAVILPVSVVTHGIPHSISAMVHIIHGWNEFSHPNLGPGQSRPTPPSVPPHVHVPD